MAPLVSFIISTVIAYRVNVHQLKLEDYKIEVLGSIKGGSLNPSSLNQLQLDVNGKYLVPLIKIAFTVAIISTTVRWIVIQISCLSKQTLISNYNSFFFSSGVELYNRNL